jgi:hypothetical protein
MKQLRSQCPNSSNILNLLALFSFLAWIKPCSKPGWVKTLQIGREGGAMFEAEQIHSCARPADAPDAARVQTIAVGFYLPGTTGSLALAIFIRFAT